MPVLRLVGRNVSAARSPFCLIAYLPADPIPDGPEGSLVVDLSTDLEPVLQVASDGVDPGEQFVREALVDGLDLRTAQWAPPHELRGRFLLESLKWGDHELLKQSGVI